MRQFFSLSLAPLLLRVILGVTFLWAGAGKLQYFDPSPAQASRLAEWGVITPPASIQPGPGGGAGDAPEPDLEPVPEPNLEPNLEPGPDLEPDPQTDAGDEPASPVDPEPAPATDPGSDPEPETDGQPNAEPASFQAGAVAIAEPESVRRLYGLALLIDASANPAPDAEGRQTMPLWPAALADGKLPVYTAWIAAISELVFGAAVLVGFFARLSALPIAGTMLAAAWLTQIGPAVQSGDALLGFLPAGLFEMAPLAAGGAIYGYTVLLWQLALLAIALALVLLGPGAVSVDRMLFGAPRALPAEDTGYGDGAAGDDAVEFVKMSRDADA